MSVGITISGGCLVLDGGCLAIGPCAGHLTPDCCLASGCCFDQANGHFQGHIYLKREYRAALDGTGPVVHTFIFEADYDFAFDGGCPGASFRGYPSDPSVYSNITLTWDGVTQTFGDDDANDLVASVDSGFTQYVGSFTSAWDGTNWEFSFSINTNETKLQALLSPLSPSSNEDVFTIAGTSDGSNAINAFPGNCVGVPEVPFGPTLDVPPFNTYSVTTTGTFDMQIVDNYCCKEDGVCVESETSNLNPEGSC